MEGDQGEEAERPSGTSSRPMTAANRPMTAASRPMTAASRPGSGRPVSSLSALNSKAWSESETTASSPRSEQSGDDNPLVPTEERKGGCWQSFSSCVGGMWSSREMNNSHEDREVSIKTTIRELVIYVIFLCVLSVVTFGMTSPTHYYYTKVMKDLFSKQPKVNNIDQFWRFMEGELLDGLHWEYWYHEGSSRNYICPGGDESTGPCPIAPADRNILYENRLLGLPRMRQLRVKNESCEIHKDFQNAILNCWSPYSSSIEEKSDFFPKHRAVTSLSAWTYQTAEQMGVSELPITGKAGEYSAHGAVQLLHSLKNESLAIVNELKESLWVSRSTRAVMVDFTVYNANINLFCVINFLFEFPATGGVLSSSTFNSVKLLRYVSSFDYILMACECVYILFIIYYIIEEILEISKLKCVYFKGTWNKLDLFVVFLSIVNQSLNIYTFFTAETKIATLLSEPDKYADFQTLGSASQLFKSVVAICVFFSWVKLFKYISFNKTMTQLTRTLSQCTGDILGFSVMFFIVFFAFAQLGYLLFGTQVKDFSTFGDACFTLLRTILGDFDFHSIKNANRILGPIFFLCYVFFVFFVLFNMFLAIINDTYSEVKGEIADQRNEFEIGDYLKKGYNNVLGKVGTRNRAMDIESTLKLASQDGEVTYEEVRQNLKKYNFSDMEIEMFFAKYDMDDDNVFGSEEGLKILKDIDDDKLYGPAEVRPKSGKESRALRSGSALSRPATRAGGAGNSEELEMLSNRVDRMEGVVSSIVSKIDMVLIKLESMEKYKKKKKQHMSKIIDGFIEGEGEDNQNEAE